MSQPLRLSAKEETSNKKCKSCGDKLTPAEREMNFDICDICIMDEAITDNELDND